MYYFKARTVQEYWSLYDSEKYICDRFYEIINLINVTKSGRDKRLSIIGLKHEARPCAGLWRWQGKVEESTSCHPPIQQHHCSERTLHHDLLRLYAFCIRFSKRSNWLSNGSYKVSGSRNIQIPKKKKREKRFVRRRISKWYSRKNYCCKNIIVWDFRRQYALKSRHYVISNGQNDR